MNKILIVDPDSVILKRMNTHLTNEGYELMIFENPQDALAACSRFTPDLILSEVDLGETDGFEFLKKVRQHTGMNKIPFIFLTYNHDDELKIKALENGADEIIHKPFESKNLIVRINLQLKLRTSAGILSETDLNGEIKSNPLKMVFDNIHDKSKSGLLRIVHSGETSFIGFKNGEIYFAKSINRIGKQAVFFLFTLLTGKFMFDEGESFPGRNVLDSYEKLMAIADKTSEITIKVLPKYSSHSRIKYVDPSLIKELRSSTDIKDFNLAGLFERYSSIYKVVHYSEFGILDLLKMLNSFVKDNRLVI